MPNRKQLLEWQNIVTNNSSTKLVMSASQLKNSSMIQVNNDLRIIQDCVNLVNKTTDPDVYFSRYKLMLEKAEHLKLFEPYISFTGDSPSRSLEKLKAEEQQSINDFLHRVVEKVECLKTDSGKKNRYQKLYTDLTPYFDRMNTENIDYVETHFNSSECTEESTNQPDVLTQIEKLGELHQKGILTDEEFNSKKGELLSKI